MKDSLKLHLLGVSFRAAPVAVREGLSFDRSAAVTLLSGVAAADRSVEALVLSTCNRTEFLLVAPDGEDPTEAWLARLQRLRPDARVLRNDCHLYRLCGTAAVRHLFRVACGLDSAIVGDVQILGQIKEARAIAAEAGTLGHYLGRTVEHAIRSAKRARRDTNIGHGAASIGSVLAGMLEDTPVSKILIVGAGEVAHDLGRHLGKRRAGQFVVVNRTAGKAVALAAACGAMVRPWDDLADAVARAEAVVVATAAPEPILRCALLERVAASRAGLPFTVIDAGVPGNVERGSRVAVLDVDAIREHRERVLGVRVAAIPEVERIVSEELDAWQGWRSRQALEGVIKSLYREVTIASDETARQIAGAATLGEGDLAGVIQRSLRRLLHEHVRSLRGLAVAGVPQAASAEPIAKGEFECAH